MPTSTTFFALSGNEFRAQYRRMILVSLSGIIFKQRAAVSLAVGMMILGMPLAALAAGPATYGVDDGTHITLWSRAATQARADALVKAYNATHKNHIDATYVPTDDYQTKVGAAAAAGGLPDLFSADVVFMPNWTSAGLFQDLTARIAALPYVLSLIHI